MKAWLKYLFLGLILTGASSSDGQECVPLVYSSPIEGAKYVNTFERLILRFKSCIDNYSIDQSDFDITGSLSGKHKVDITRIDDGVTLVLTPTTPFTPKESVQLNILDFAGSGTCETINFKISGNSAKVGWKSLQKDSVVASNNNIQKSNHTVFDFPTIKTNISGPVDSSYIFVTFPSGMGFGGYLAILDNYGEVQYVAEDSPWDFKKTKNNKLVYYSGYNGQWEVLDSTYAKIDSFTCDQFDNDFHEIQFLDNGNALLICSEVQEIDMSLVVAGGDTAANVYGERIQEIDKNTKLAVFSWTTFDHFQVTDNKHQAGMTAKN
ncbi:MAG: aryl-sulfate sulfotransferase, partial [Bacteroidetes bacterium]|nr:aryl-sulfate sulfotransferase [Bacteroidota bacterium]